jgi:hypothetical protein
MIVDKFYHFHHHRGITLIAGDRGSVAHNVKENKTNDSTAKIGMNFEYIAINVRNFNSKADFRENATSLNIKQ